jgi:hypothetical protein
VPNNYLTLTSSGKPSPQRVLKFVQDNICLTLAKNKKGLKTIEFQLVERRVKKAFEKQMRKHLAQSKA